MSYLSKISAYCLASLVLSFLGIKVYSQTQVAYSFIVAGHAYGSHDGTNIGLHPKFLTSLNTGYDTALQFMVFTGDIVNHSNEESWEQVESELESYSKPYYYVMGNHDANEVGYDVFNEKFGNSYYTFTQDHSLFIILNSNETLKSISPKQVTFLRETIASASESVENVFVFFHEVLWNSHEKYKDVKSNSRSRYAEIVDYSNYWEDIHPLLEQYQEKYFYVIAGDVAGNTDAIPAFYDTWSNVTLVASGMGEVEEENYLLVRVFEDNSIDLSLVPLNIDITLNALENYAIPQKPDTIYGDTNIGESTAIFQYKVDDVKSAQAYEWQLPDNCKIVGSENDNSIEIEFTDAFTSGTISVKAIHESFGKSEAVSLLVSRYPASASEFKNDKSNLLATATIVKGHCNIEIESKTPDNLWVCVYNITGREVYKQSTSIRNKVNLEFDISKANGQMLFVRIQGEKNRLTLKKIVD